MVSDAGDQSHPSPRLSRPIRRRSAEAQLGRAAALTCSSVCSCGGKRKGPGCGQAGSGVSAPSRWEGSGWLWETLLEGISVFGSQAGITFPAPHAASSALSPLRLCRAGLSPALLSPSSKKQASRRGSKPFSPFAQMCYNGVFLATLPNRGPRY